MACAIYFEQGDHPFQNVTTTYCYIRTKKFVALSQSIIFIWIKIKHGLE